MLPTFRLLLGDCVVRLRDLEQESVQMAVSSPPYLGLRDYGVEGQIGLEETPERYVERLVEVFAEVRRVLKPDGTLWLNLGDSYCNTDKWGGGGKNAGKQTVAADGSVPSWAVRAKRPPIPGVKPKDLMGIPWLVAFALRAEGWWLRSEVIWSKPNAMPEPVQDRPTRAHEHLFLLSKSERYFYDVDAVREPFANGIEGATPWGSNDRERNRGGRGDDFTAGTGTGWTPSATGRNRRTVWTIPTQPFPGAHFATFPEELVRPCVLAGSRPGDTVLDPFSGSGTTGAVSIALGRSYVGCEINPEYVEMSRQRIGGVAPLLAREVA